MRPFVDVHTDDDWNYHINRINRALHTRYMVKLRDQENTAKYSDGLQFALCWLVEGHEWDDILRYVLRHYAPDGLKVVPGISPATIDEYRKLWRRNYNILVIKGVDPSGRVYLDDD